MIIEKTTIETGLKFNALVQHCINGKSYGTIVICPRGSIEVILSNNYKNPKSVAGLGRSLIEALTKLKNEMIKTGF